MRLCKSAHPPPAGAPSPACVKSTLIRPLRGHLLPQAGEGVGKKIPSSPGLRRGNVVYGFRGLDYIIGAGAEGIATGAALRFAGRRAFLAAFFLAGRLAALRAVFFAVFFAAFLAGRRLAAAFLAGRRLAAAFLAGLRLAADLRAVFFAAFLAGLR